MKLKWCPKCKCRHFFTGDEKCSLPKVENKKKEAKK